MSDAGIEDPEQAWPSTNLICWPTMRLATATACLGSQASSWMTILILRPSTPPASLTAAAAASAPRFIWSPIEASGPVIGPARAIVMSCAATGVASAASAAPARESTRMLRIVLDSSRDWGRQNGPMLVGHGDSGERVKSQPLLTCGSGGSAPAHPERRQAGRFAYAARGYVETLALVEA